MLSDDIKDVQNPNDTETLILAARRGDSEALGTLLDKFRNYLLFLVRMQISPQLNVKVDDMDIVQETFAEAYQAFPNFRGESEVSFLAWLRQILATTLAGTYRHYIGTKSRDIRLEQDVHAQVDQSSVFWDRIVAETSTPSLKVSRKETEVQLLNAVAKLPEHYREVLRLRNTEGLSFPEIANRMERSVDSIQKLWVRALSQLRDLMEPER